MRRVIQWVVTNPTLVNLMMVGICVLGLVSMEMVPKEVFPESALDLIIVRVTYRGAGPKEIENGVLIKIEEAVQGISGVSDLTSEGKENLGTVRIEVDGAADTGRVLRDVKDQIDQIASFPKDAETPAVYEVVRKAPVVSLALYGEVSRAALQTVAERIKDDLLAKSRIKFVEIKGSKEREISIEVKEKELRKYNLQISDIGRALNLANFDLSGGKLKTKREDFLIRVYGKRYLAKELENIPVKTLPGGNVIRIRDIATARETFDDSPTEFYYNGQKSLLINVMRTSTGNTLKIGAQAIAYLDEAKKILPAGVKLALQRDQNIPLRDRINLLVKNGLQGLVLVLITLSLLMNLRLAFWVAAGLPIAMLGTFILFDPAGLTVNVLSLFGLILVIGILVDDAIVVAENVYSHIEQGKHPIRAAIDGTMEVLPAVFAAVFTTILAFTPMFFMGGIIGKFIFAIPAVVSLSLLLSLVEGFLILPPHLAHSLKPRNSTEHRQNRIRKALEDGFQWLSRDLYARHLHTALRYRWAVLALGVALFMMTIGMMRGGVVKFVFFPRLEGDQIVARVLLKPGTPKSRTRELGKRIEDIALKLGEKYKKKYGRDVILARSTWIGRFTQRGPGFAPPTGEEVLEVQLELLQGEVRPISSYKIVDDWRKATGLIEGALTVSFDTLGTPPLGRALEFQLLSNNNQQLAFAAKKLRKKLGTFQGVTDPEDDMTPGKRELRLKLLPLAKSLGVTLQDIALQIRYRITGQEVMRLQRGRDEIRVYVRYPESNRKSVNDLNDVWIQTRSGKQIPLRQLATWSYTRDLEVIRRINRKRIVTVYANLDDTKGSRVDIIRELKQSTFPMLRRQAPDLTISSSGQSKEQAKVFGGMAVAFPLALFGIFTLLVAVFGSYVQALLIISMIPFGIIGAIQGHFLLGRPLTILSFFGIVGLSGMVVNDSLVLVDKLNRLIRDDGMSVFQAAWEAGQTRLRAILSTTLTTFAGLAPLLLEKSLQAQFLIPMAISIAFGIVFATFITLMLVPCLYLISNDIRCFIGWMRSGRWPSMDEVDPIVKQREEKQKYNVVE
ncbi:MAG: efflux RND transporter permease subunit [Deltaproteobacteria bacterium]|nr:MAG: efflux RND transporter permease subunit [Deltaproteobacteria bacterium]